MRKKVLVVMIGENIPPSLEEAVRRNRWDTLYFTETARMLRETYLRSVQLLVIGVSGGDRVIEQAVEAVLGMRAGGRSTPLLVIGAPHSDLLESRARRAGVDAYLPAGATENEITRAARWLLRKKTPRHKRAKDKDPQHESQT